MKASQTLWDAFFFLLFFYWDVYYWIQNGSGRFVGCRGKRTADKTNQRSERDYVPLCGLAGISLCKILSSSDAHMTSVSAKPAEVCLDEKSFTTNELLVPFLQNSERNGFLKEQKGCRVMLDAAAWVQFCQSTFKRKAKHLDQNNVTTVLCDIISCLCSATCNTLSFRLDVLWNGAQPRASTDCRCCCLTQPGRWLNRWYQSFQQNTHNSLRYSQACWHAYISS